MRAMHNPHAIVWMDHAEAIVLLLQDESVERARVLAGHGRRHIHHRRGAIGDGREPEDHDYFARVAKALAGAQRILLTGPASGKDEFHRYLKSHLKGLAGKIAALRKVDHPGEAELLALGRDFFLREDRMGRNSAATKA